MTLVGFPSKDNTETFLVRPETLLQLPYRKSEPELPPEFLSARSRKARSKPTPVKVDVFDLGTELEKVQNMLDTARSELAKIADKIRGRA